MIKSDGSDIGQERDAKTVRLNSGEWDESVQNLAGTFNNTEAAKPGGFEPQRSGFGGASQSADTSAHPESAGEMYENFAGRKTKRIAGERDVLLCDNSPGQNK